MMLRAITCSVERILFPALAATAVGIYLAVSMVNRRSDPINRRPLIGSLARLKKRTIGRGQQQITKLLGRPRTVVTGPTPIWYYAIDPRQHLAMAISFHNNRASRVEFFHPSAMRGINTVHSTGAPTE